MYYTVSEISGDYAVLRSEESGLERSVALALLPEDIAIPRSDAPLTFAGILL